MSIENSSIRARMSSFRYAGQGLKRFFLVEGNALIHLIATIVVLILGFSLSISAREWIPLVIVMGGVWMAELFNTAIEKSMDFQSREIHPEIKYIKDVSAAAVLMMSVAALVTGCLVFVPKF